MRFALISATGPQDLDQLVELVAGELGIVDSGDHVGVEGRTSGRQDNDGQRNQDETAHHGGNAIQSTVRCADQ